MAQPSSQEQYLLELVNRFRMNPTVEDDLLFGSNDADVQNTLGFFGTNGAVLSSQFSSLSAAQPLAWSTQLHDSALTHSQLMISFDQQSHNLPNEPALFDRINNAGGNTYTAAAENIYAFSFSPLYTHAGFVIDWGDDDNDPNNGYGTGIQNPPGHRNSLINNVYTEAGFALPEENVAATDVGLLVSTQHLGDRDTGSAVWLLGVAYRDMDDDDFYSVGEGLGAITVKISGNGFSTSVQTNSAGGYQVLVPQANLQTNPLGVDYTVTFESLGKTLGSYAVTVKDENEKQDLLIEVADAPTSGLGKITGIQFRDLNSNGVQDIGERGIVGRSVFLDANGNRQLDNGEVSTTTDGDGVYVFNNLTPGSYRVAPVIPADRNQTFPVVGGAERYQIDDGGSENLLGYTSGGLIIFNRFTTLTASETLTSISVGLSKRGNPTKLLVYQDADGDGRPDNDEKVAEVATSLTGDFGFANVAVSPIALSGTFFIGALYEGNNVNTTVVPHDSSVPAGQSFVAISSDPNTFTAFDAQSINWLLRANTAGLVTQQVEVEANETTGGVNFGDRATTINSDSGTPGNDTLNGTASVDIISGLAGNDRIDARAGDDILFGGDGEDSLFGYEGKDDLFGGGSRDILYGMEDEDLLVGEAGDDALFGGSANDTLNGGDGNDRLDGEAGDDELNGGDGNDNINGGAGNDVANGGDGNDLLAATAGNDTLSGGNGNDFYTVDSLADIVIEAVDSGTDRVQSTVGWTLQDNVEQLKLINGFGNIDGTGNSLNNRLFGNESNNALLGVAGSDILYGFAGNDTLVGGSDTDFLFGDVGDDLLIGGSGADILFGGAGSDTFSYSTSGDGVDAIRDFSATDDILDLTTLFDGLAYGGSDPLADGYLQFGVSGSSTFIQVDADGAGTNSNFVNLARIANFTAVASLQIGQNVLV